MPKVLIISQGSAFMTNTLETNLKRDGIEIVMCEPEIRGIDQKIENADLVLLFAGDYIREASAVISYTASKCSEECLHFCVAGYPNELALIEKSADISMISAEFTRPFDMKDLSADIRALVLGETAKTDPRHIPETAKHHILLCDDDAMFLKMMQDWLSERYRVTAVKTGLAAVSAAVNTHPELILLDFDMPKMSGAQVLQLIRSEKSTAEIPIVFLTAHSDKESIMNVMYFKPEGCMLKHQAKENILGSINRFFETKKWS